MWRIQAPEIHGNMHYQQRNRKYTSARMNLRYAVVGTTKKTRMHLIDTATGAAPFRKKDISQKLQNIEAN
jgi:hypothetical protein